jgi:nucleotide-binding universal stress UspA family protein
MLEGKAGPTSPLPQELIREYESDTVERLEEAASEINAQSEAVSSTSVPRGLQELAEEHNADLIVVGSSHRGQIGQVFPGSVGFQLLHGAPCALSIATRGFCERPESELTSIVIGFDGSPESEVALRGAIGLAETCGASLEVVTVAEPPPVIYGKGAGAQGVPELMEAIEELAREKFEHALAVAPSDLTTEGSFLTGDTEAGLREASEDADLLVLGSRGYGPVRGVLLGSVSMEILRSASCPVVVFPRGVEAPRSVAESAEEASSR